MSALIAAIVVLTNAAFTVAYDTDARCPSWVEYELTPGEIVVTNRAAIPFRADDRIAESDNAEDYAGSGYDRGHMAPAADFNFNRKALGETYLYSNICPQLPTFNRGRWAEIEREVRALGMRGAVKVLTFPEYDSGRTNRIGRVRIPDSFVKVAYGDFGVRMWRVDFSDRMGSSGESEKSKTRKHEK